MNNLKHLHAGCGWNLNVTQNVLKSVYICADSHIIESVKHSTVGVISLKMPCRKILMIWEEIIKTDKRWFVKHLCIHDVFELKDMQTLHICVKFITES